MMLTNGLVQGGYEILILRWSIVCAQTVIFLVLGTIALVSLILTGKGFNPTVIKSEAAE